LGDEIDEIHDFDKDQCYDDVEDACLGCFNFVFFVHCPHHIESCPYQSYNRDEEGGDLEEYQYLQEEFTLNPLHKIYCLTCIGDIERRS